MHCVTAMAQDVVDDLKPTGADVSGAVVGDIEGWSQA